ncbi:MAG: hypothetical protein LH660_10950 [Phormidesmis sp. CAN_BIN36]|nr:hypothetical protein [Phormidesmis sp. CAN_BIN36]
MQLNVRTATTATLGLLFLGACSSGNQASTTSSPAASTPAATQPSATTSPATSGGESASKTAANHGGQGGQVVESGPYHLELVTGKESSGTHLDLFLQKGDNHEAIPNAKVTAQVQLPDSTQQALEMKYDAGEKHYTAILPGTAAGSYKVAILSDISGEKVNGRFSFTR